LPLLGRSLLAQGDTAGFFCRIKPPNLISTRLRGILALLYGQAYLMMKKFDGAQASFTEALRVKEFYGAARIGLAWVAIEQNQLDRAAQEIDQATSPVEVGMVRGEIFRRRAQPAAARAAFAQVLTHDPHHLNARLGKAAMELALGAADAARADLALAAAAAPDHPLVKRLQELLADQYDDSGLLPQIYALDRNLSSSATLQPLAQALAESVAAGRMQVALLAARRLQEWAPKVALGYATEGAVRMAQRDWLGAVRALTAAYQREPTAALAANLAIARSAKNSR